MARSAREAAAQTTAAAAAQPGRPERGVIGLPCPPSWFLGFSSRPPSHDPPGPQPQPIPSPPRRSSQLSSLSPCQLCQDRESRGFPRLCGSARKGMRWAAGRPAGGRGGWLPAPAAPPVAAGGCSAESQTGTVRTAAGFPRASGR
jgi:hypothetical protein